MLIPIPLNSDVVPPPPGDRLDQILDVVSRTSARMDSLQRLGKTVDGIARKTSDFEVFVRRRFREDDFIFARMKEESDAEFNRARENRVVVSGLQGPSSTPTTHAIKKKHYTDLLTRLVSLACASVDPLPVIVDVYVNLRRENGGQPLVEAKFDSVSGALMFRREGVRLAKAKHAEFGSLFFSNSVNQSTRVRIEILKALAKKLATQS